MTTDKTEPRDIYKIIPQIMAEVGAIGKDHTAKQGYAYRGIDDVVAALSPLMAEHGMFVYPCVRRIQHEQVLVGKNQTPMMHVIADISYTFAASDGSSFEAGAIGEATDSGDKAGNKAMASAYKYALTQTFAIPTSDPKDTEQSSPDLSAPRVPDKAFSQDEPPFAGADTDTNPF